MTTKLGYVLTEDDSTRHFFPDIKALTEWIATKSVTTHESIYGVTTCSDKLGGSHIDNCFYEEATSSSAGETSL